MNQETFSPNPPAFQVKEPQRSDTQKVRDILRYMADNCDRFSLQQFFETLFNTEDGDLQKSANIFLKSGAVFGVLDEWEKRIPGEMSDWVMEKATKTCQREFGWLTDRASQGPHKSDADFLRISANMVSVSMLEEFKLDNLSSRYARVTPKFQQLLTGILGKEEELDDEKKLRVWETSPGCTLITSIALNLRSRRTNYHAVINGLVLWDNRAHKRIHQTYNRYGVSSSYPFLLRSLKTLSRDALRMALTAAADEDKVKAFLYDNFNWVSRAWEATALHGNITPSRHDEVSAILLVLPHGTQSASHITSRARFTASFGTRHTIPPPRALMEISPTPDDVALFRSNAILHIKYILSDEVKCFQHFRSSLPEFEDPNSIIPCITEEYCLPTFVQEQGLTRTRANMIVLRHYFLDVLCLPVPIFERVMFFVIGDRLTTVRDRAAQDQRSVDRSRDSIDWLTPFSTTNGLMHSCLNYIGTVGRNAWGGTAPDPVSLITLRDKLPNRSGLNLRKIDYYAWLHFYDVILHALVIKAAMTILGLTCASDWVTYRAGSPDSFTALCMSISDQFLIPSVNRLEADGIKTILGNTNSGHAVLLMHDLMLLREMRHAIKYGHPTRIHRIVRFWTPMFYAGGSFNYANEFMELLHNMAHDWPSDSAQVAFNGMLVNSTGKPGHFKEADIRCEHLNDDIKAHAHGVNAMPESLEKSTPALGHIGKLTDQLYHDLGVEEQNQHHAKLSQHRDAEILVAHFVKHNIFDFSKDKKSEHFVIDLFRYGQRRLAGPDGGHAKHLARHKLRLRTRNGESVPDEHISEPRNELLESLDQGHIERVVNTENDEIRDVIISTENSTDVE